MITIGINIINDQEYLKSMYAGLLFFFVDILMEPIEQYETIF